MLKFAKDVDAVELGLSAISQAPGQSQIGLVIAALVIITGSLLYHYLRRFYYPCLTISELNNAEEHLKDTFNKAHSTSSLCGRELEETTHAKLCLEERASEIRSEALRGSPSLLKTHLGIVVELVPSIIGWYTHVVELQRDIMIIVERVKRSRINAERKMHEATYATVDAQPAATGREVVGPQETAALRHRNRRPDAPMFGAAVDNTPTVADG
ncbi:40S ribosomal protein S6 [Paramarasmius palmivorus]|uniref:40S ribosomal protein S6 n=1 Tax=Paramarasmius palmivorus TaxID=297713 RepID=A0AAW0EGN5_9AGAR